MGSGLKQLGRCLTPPRHAGLCVVNVYINYEKKFAFVEFRTGALRQPSGRCCQALHWQRQLQQLWAAAAARGASQKN